MVQWKKLGCVLTREAWPVWLLLGGVAAAWGISYILAKDTEEHVLYVGTGLQVFGFITVGYSIYDLSKKFGVQSPLKAISLWWEKLRGALCPPVSTVGTIYADSVTVTSRIEPDSHGYIT